MKKVYIYRDRGVNPQCVKALLNAFDEFQRFSISFIDSTRIKEPRWMANCDLLIFPGGADLPYLDALQGLGNQNILEFVKEGGKYLGICAGGYYGSGYVEFEKGYPLEILGERELKFFPGIARGPIYGLGKFSYENENGAQVAKLKLTASSEKVFSYYNGGCAFVDAKDFPHITTIAQYEDIENQPAAIVECHIGKGKAILSGVHPEYSYTQSSNVKKYESKRKRLFEEILSKFNLVELLNVN